MKAVYIHGLGGKGTGSSACNVKELLSEYEFSAGTYDLLKPMESFLQIQKDVEDADLIVASSLGGFYASALSVKPNQTVILINPCLKPHEVIEGILYEDQKRSFNRDLCLTEWKELAARWNKTALEAHNHFFGVFADQDELFHYQNVFDEYFAPAKFKNSVVVSGKHELAKDKEKLKAAFDKVEELYRPFQLTGYIKSLEKIYGDQD